MNYNKAILLGLGLCLDTQLDKGELITTEASFYSFISRNSSRHPNRGIIRCLESPMLISIREQAPVLPSRLQEAFKSLSRRNNMRNVPADKKGLIVILDADSYKQKATEVLSDMATHEKLRTCPRLHTNKLVRKSIRDLVANYPNPVFFKSLFSVNCSLAYLYGLLKLNKPNIRLRLIISSAGTVTRSLAGWLARMLAPYVGKLSTAHLKNSLDFKDRMVEVSAIDDIRDVKMMSFDATALFTRMPLEPTLDFIGRK